MKGVPSISPTVSESPALFQDSSATPLSLLGLFCPGVEVQETSYTLLSRIVDDWFYRLLNTSQMISLQEAQCFHDSKEQDVGLCRTLRNITREKPIALLTFFDNLKDLSDICETDECDAV